MDVRKGDFVLIRAKIVDVDTDMCEIELEGGDVPFWVDNPNIKSVERTLPKVGDTVTWGHDPDSQGGVILASSDDQVAVRWIKTGRISLHDITISEFNIYPNFRIINRAAAPPRGSVGRYSPGLSPSETEEISE